MELTLEDRMQSMRNILAEAGIEAEVTNIRDEIIVTINKDRLNQPDGAFQAGKLEALLANVRVLDRVIGIRGVGRTDEPKKLRDLVSDEIRKLGSVPPRNNVDIIPDPPEKNEYGVNREARRKAAKAKRLEAKRMKRIIRTQGRVGKGGQKT